MKKKMVSILLGAVLAISLSACAEDRRIEEFREDEYEEVETEEIVSTEAIERTEATEDTTNLADIIKSVIQPKSAEISKEEFCYAAKLNGMVQAPELFWGDESQVTNIPEENEFAILDINSDGMKELLVKYNHLSVNGGVRSADIYQNDDLCGSVFVEPMADVYHVNADFYQDGTIIEEDNMDEYWSAMIYQSGVAVEGAYEWDSSLPADCYFGKEFPTAQDVDGDGKIYVWYDIGDTSVGEHTYLTKEEHDARMAELTAGKEKLDITWRNITEENIKEAVASDIQDEKPIDIIESHGYLATYISKYNDVETEKRSLYDVSVILGLYSYSDSGKYDIMSTFFPSSRVISEAGDDNVTTYEINTEDFRVLTDEAFNNAYSAEEVLAETEVTDNGNGTLTVDYEWMLGDGPQYNNYVLSTEKDNGKIIVKGICLETYPHSYAKGNYFECVLEENAKSPLDGYKLLEIEKEKLYEITM